MPSLQKLYERFDDRVHVLSRKMGADHSAKHYFDMLKQNGMLIRRLTAEQKQQVQQVWNGKVESFDTHELVLSVTGRFDPYICSEALLRTNIELRLNTAKLKYGFSDKNYFDKMFPNIPMPKTIVRNINGSFLDSDYRPLRDDEVMALLTPYDKVIVKPSIENGVGKGVRLYRREDFAKITREYSRNYLIQQVFCQHETLSSLNESSVNVVRVVSLNLNGNVSPVSCALRCGATGAVTDNSITKDGRGMFVVGVTPRGTLKDKAYFSCGESMTVAPNGRVFADLALPNFEQALALTKRIHEQLPHFRFVGFDVCFAQDGEPTIMEFNIRGPGVLYYQYVNGPLFGNRTQEIIDTFCR